MKKFSLIIISALLLGCNGGSNESAPTDNETNSPVGDNLPQPTVRHDFTPISNLSTVPYVAPIYTAPQYLTPIYTGMTDSNIYAAPATVHSEIAALKPLSGYDININLSYQYRVKMDINLTNGMCVSAWFWNGNPTTWSDENIDCMYNYPVYDEADFMAIYGDATVKDGDNFILTFSRIGSVSIEWLIK